MKIDLQKYPDYVREMAHAIGLDCVGFEDGIYHSYRNRYGAPPDHEFYDLWMKLLRSGYATRRKLPNTYRLTRKGLNYLGEQFGIIIYDFEDDVYA